MTADTATLLDRLATLAASPGRRTVVGITGPPGAGKTTLVEALLEAASGRPDLAGRVAHVPMDGFHLTNADLDRLGRRERKGAPDTFDAAAYAETLAALRDPERAPVAAPAFDHAVGEPVAGAIVVGPEADIVLTEGNYLLLEEGGWPAVRSLLDEVWFCALEDAERQTRLIGRHIAAGREPDDAREWVGRSDEANAQLVTPTAAQANLVLRDGRVVERP